MADLKITFSQQHNHSMVLDSRRKRDLADHLDITVKELDRLVDRGDLYDEHGDALTRWLDDNIKLASRVSVEDVEIDKILAA